LGTGGNKTERKKNKKEEQLHMGSVTWTGVNQGLSCGEKKGDGSELIKVQERKAEAF